MLNLEIRQVDPRDAPAVAVLLDRAFEGDTESRLVESLRSDDAWIPELSLGGFDGSRLVGYALLTRVFIGEKRTPALSLAPLAVEPDAQRKGVGGLLTMAALSAARHLGEGIVVVLGHAAYYPRYGFRPARELGIVSPWSVPDEAWMALELREHAADGVEGTVEYPAAFYDAL